MRVEKKKKNRKKNKQYQSPVVLSYQQIRLINLNEKKQKIEWLLKKRDVNID